MAQIFDKIILLFLSFFIVKKENPVYALWHIDSISFQTQLVITLLLVLICTTLCSYCTDKRAKGIISSLYILGMYFVPTMVYTFPVVFYDVWLNKSLIEYILVAVTFYSNFNTFSFGNELTIIFLCFLSVVLAEKTKKSERLITLVKQVRDDEEEKNLLLSEKNKNLLEKQDYEVYVATLKERNRIAREIHDNVGHMLTRSILQVGALMTIHKEQPLNSQLDAVKSSLDIAMNNVRESVHDLHDESIDLKQAVGELVETLNDKFEVFYDYDVSHVIDRKYKYAIVAIVKEGVSNIIKHSSNNHVDVILREHPGMLQLIIHDYMLGEKRDNINAHFCSGLSGGIGLENIKDRVLGLNGNVSIDDSNGFRIFITLPKIM